MSKDNGVYLQGRIVSRKDGVYRIDLDRPYLLSGRKEGFSSFGITEESFRSYGRDLGKSNKVTVSQSFVKGAAMKYFGVNPQDSKKSEADSLDSLLSKEEIERVASAPTGKK